MTAALRRVRGVNHCSVDRTRDEALVVRTAGTARDEALVAAVRGVGYSASVIPVSTVTLAFEGESCSARASDALRRAPGVRQVSIGTRGRAKVEFDRRRTDAVRLCEAVRSAGVEARPVPDLPVPAAPASRPAAPAPRVIRRS